MHAGGINYVDIQYQVVNNVHIMVLLPVAYSYACVFVNELGAN